jgi:5-methylthioadenosine/S-adenosylhomocysteine deaminase
MPDTTLIAARYIVPICPKGAVLENHAVRIEDGVITEIFPIPENRGDSPEACWVDLPDHVLLPGLFNMHSHSPMSLLRGCADDIDLESWLTKHIWPLETRWVDREFVGDGTRLAIAEMIRSGITLFNDLYFFPETMAKVAVESGMRAVIGIPVLDNPTPWSSGADQCFKKGLNMQQEFGDESLISIALAPHSPYTCSDPTLARVADLCGQTNMPVHMHLLESRWEIDHSLEHHGLHPLERLENLGLLNERLLAVHMTQMSGEDIDRVAARGVHVVHCPHSNLKLASGFCPVAGLLDAGINVTIGTDGAASNNSLDLFGEAKTAALLCKGASGNPMAGCAQDILDMLTINAATALGVDGRLGSIETGKLADLCAVNLQVPESQPSHNIISDLVYSVSRQQVTDVWVAGRRLLNDRVLTTIDESGALAKAGQWRIDMSFDLTEMEASRDES